jgi:hypothetical protein
MSSSIKAPPAVNEPLLPFRLLGIHAIQSRHAVPSLGKAIDLRLFDYEHFRDLHNFHAAVIRRANGPYSIIWTIDFSRVIFGERLAPAKAKIVLILTCRIYCFNHRIIVAPVSFGKVVIKLVCPRPWYNPRIECGYVTFGNQFGGRGSKDRGTPRFLPSIIINS